MTFSPVQINLVGFKVNLLDRASLISFGPSLQLDQLVTTKLNYGFGEENGDLSAVYLPLNVVMDQDLLDSNTVKNSVV